MAASRRKRLNKAEVNCLIQELLQATSITAEQLLEFAETINGSPFKEAPKAKPKTMTMKQAKDAVLQKFNCKTVTELRKNKTFMMSMTDEEVKLKSKDDWLKLYRRWIAVPDSERNLSGKTCINGIDVLENFRPWHVFNLNPETATTEDIKKAFRELAKVHHPDVGGDERVFERLQKMRDSVLAMMS